jgi:hypothetical protein
MPGIAKLGFTPLPKASPDDAGAWIDGVWRAPGAIATAQPGQTWGIGSGGLGGGTTTATTVADSDKRTSSGGTGIMGGGGLFGGGSDSVNIGDGLTGADITLFPVGTGMGDFYDQLRAKNINQVGIDWISSQESKRREHDWITNTIDTDMDHGLTWWDHQGGYWLTRAAAKEAKRAGLSPRAWYAKFWADDYSGATDREAKEAADKAAKEAADKAAAAKAEADKVAAEKALADAIKSTSGGLGGNKTSPSGLLSNPVVLAGGVAAIMYFLLG